MAREAEKKIDALHAQARHYIPHRSHTHGIANIFNLPAFSRARNSCKLRCISLGIYLLFSFERERAESSSEFCTLFLHATNSMRVCVCVFTSKFNKERNTRTHTTHSETQG